MLQEMMNYNFVTVKDWAFGYNKGRRLNGLSQNAVYPFDGWNDTMVYKAALRGSQRELS